MHKPLSRSVAQHVEDIANLSSVNPITLTNCHRCVREKWKAARHLLCICYCMQKKERWIKWLQSSLHHCEHLYVYFRGICMGKPPPYRCTPSMLSFMSMLSWWLRRQAGESTSVFQESFQRTIFRHHFPSLSGFDKAHIKWFPTPHSPLLPTFYSLYLCIMYIHMYTVRKSVMLPT